MAETEGKVAEIGKRRPKQAEVPGTERARIPAIEQIAEEYAETRDEWQKLGKKLEDLKADLHDEMRNHKLKVYVLEESEQYEKVEIVRGEDDIKVRRKKGRPAAAVGDDD